MKKLFIAIALLMPQLLHAGQEAAPDSIATELKEVVVTADTQIETSEKVILRPTALEKKHSTNGYALLENMNLPDFDVNAQDHIIATATGRDVVVLINGVEALPYELATLAAADIVQIDCRRNPGGKYAGSGAVMNFITVQYDYGGNVYVSAEQGLARMYGDYISMANYRKDAVTLTLTTNGKWDTTSQLNSAEDRFELADGVLHRSVTPVESSTRTNSQYLNFKFAHAAGNHSFDISLALTRSAAPRNLMVDNVAYSGLYDFKSTVTRLSREHALSPVLKMHYNLYLPGGHTVMVNANIRHGHTDFRSSYAESYAGEILNNTLENNVLACATLGYFKAFASGLSIGTTVDEYYNYYRDAYSGSFNNTQTLTNNHLMAMLHMDGSLPCGLSYYASAGITDLYSTIGTHSDNQLSPKAFYGAIYAFNPRHTLSVSGNYVHSIYNPSYKNDAVIRTSFFEATMGNPDLRQLNAFQNLVSYNGRVGRFGVSATYDFLKYFDNTSNRYFADGNIMYRQLVNDGDFHYHKLTLGASARLVDNRLRLRANATYSAVRFGSASRPRRSRDWRADFSASYMFGHWQAKAACALPYSLLSIEGVSVRNPVQYGLSLGWQKGCWAAECNVDNFLDRRICTRTEADYGPYLSLAQALSDRKGRNISLSVTYMLPYGKKTEREQVKTESAINSAILRPF